MAEQQLIDYIKKAKAAGQSDEQTRALLYKNGWTEAEVSEAYLAISQPTEQAQLQARPQSQPQRPQPQVQPQTRPQFQTQPQQPAQFSEGPEQASSQPQTQPQQQRPQPQVQPQQPQQPQARPQSQPAYQQPSYGPGMQEKMPSSSQILPKQNLGGQARKSHVVLKIFMVLIILIILAGAGYFIAGQYFNLPWNPFTPSPKTVVSKMLESMKSVKSSQSKTEVEIAVVGGNNASQGSLSFSMSGGSDMTDINNAKANFSIIVDFTAPDSAGAQSAISANANIIGLGNTLYFKINSTSMPTGFSYPGVDISQITGRWFKFDQDSAAALLEAEVTGPTNFDASQLNNSAQVQKIKNMLSLDIFSDYMQLSDQVVSGQNTYHYLITIGKDKLENLINKIITSAMQEEISGQTQNPANGSSSLVTNMAQAFAKTLVDAIGDIKVETWIGKKDYLLYQAKIDKTIDLSKIIPGADIKLSANFSTTSADFNKPITVQEPQDFQKIETIILPLLKVQKIRSDMNQVDSVAQTVFSTNNSYSLLCRAGLLSGYLKMGLMGLSNDIVSQGAKVPTCFAGPQGYCVSTQLADGSYLCIDERGVLGETRCVSSATVCK